MNTDRGWKAKELVQLVLAGVLAAAGMAMALLPHAWIEDRLGIELDGGSGLLELLSVVVLVGAAAVLALRVVRRPGGGVRRPNFPTLTR